MLEYSITLEKEEGTFGINKHIISARDFLLLDKQVEQTETAEIISYAVCYLLFV